MVKSFGGLGSALDPAGRAYGAIFHNLTFYSKYSVDIHAVK